MPQFPQLAELPLEPVGEGLDNVALRVGTEWVFRFPLRDLGGHTMEGELAALPIMAPHLPVAVPEPVYVGRPELGYPYRFAGAPFIPGVSGETVPVGERAEDVFQISDETGAALTQETCAALRAALVRRLDRKN